MNINFDEILKNSLEKIPKPNNLDEKIQTNNAAIISNICVEILKEYHQKLIAELQAHD